MYFPTHQTCPECKTEKGVRAFRYTSHPIERAHPVQVQGRICNACRIQKIRADLTGKRLQTALARYEIPAPIAKQIENEHRKARIVRGIRRAEKVRRIVTKQWRDGTRLGKKEREARAAARLDALRDKEQ
jgi:hypothetical protein